MNIIDNEYYILCNVETDMILSMQQSNIFLTNTIVVWLHFVKKNYAM